MKNKIIESAVNTYKYAKIYRRYIALSVLTGICTYSLIEYAAGAIEKVSKGK